MVFISVDCWIEWQNSYKIFALSKHSKQSVYKSSIKNSVNFINTIIVVINHTTANTMPSIGQKAVNTATAHLPGILHAEYPRLLDN